MNPPAIEPIAIRKATAEDQADLVAFNQAMARETENRELDPTTLQGGVAHMLAGKAEGLYLVAERTSDSRLLASMMVTYEWSDWRCGLFWWIQSVYVTPEARRRGIFSALYRHLEAMARSDRHCCGLRLYVEQDNATAMSTYRHLGMQETHYRLYETDFAKP